MVFHGWRPKRIAVEECEKRYGDRRAEFEEPCKLAVAQHFEVHLTKGGATHQIRCSFSGIWWATMINHWFFGVLYFQTNTKNWDSIWFCLSLSGGFTTEPTKTIRNRDQQSSKRGLMGWMSHLLTNHKDRSGLRHFKDPFIIVLGVCPARIKLHNCRSVKSSEGFTLHGGSNHKRIIKNP